MKIVFILFILIVSVNAFSEEEAWYLNFGLGYTSFDLRGDGEKIEDCSGDISCIDIQADIGIYFPIGIQPMIVGLDIDFHRRFGSGSNSGVDYSIDLGMTSFLLVNQYYFMGEVKNGPYIGAELGFSYFSINSKVEFAGESVSDSESGDYGLAYGVSFGYAIPITDGASFVPELYYSARNSSDDSGEDGESIDFEGSFIGITANLLF